ncbi:hypothetical protein BJ508DRAFT_89242 [Ascobolus immersus RN42]|uniref:Uncharacterized protein n=1 Tax=Ascobolus immersus RN42 TaxID=1160509 RepID=A0A3N4IED8_ASCIM|nr:hypothetical protein BJ508DRAFT_89242 [Ascobolus immersus RN42]
MNKLTPEEQAHIPNGSDFNQGNTVLAIIEEATRIRDLQAQSSESAWTFTNRKGETINAREKLDKIIRGFNEYARVIDVAVGHQPETTSLIWGSVRFMLQVYLNYQDAIELLIQTIERIASTMALAEYYASVYISVLGEGRGISFDGIMESKLSVAWQNKVSAALPEFYAAILVFSLKARLYIAPASRLERTLAPLKPASFRFKDLIGEIDAKQKALKSLANLAQMRMTEDIRNSMAFMVKNSVVNTIQDLFLHDISPKDALTWLNAVHCKRKYESSKDRRLEGTCTWIHFDKKFSGWASGENPGHLWVVGIPGAGKTVLASSLIDDLERNTHTNSYPTSAVLYFFFMYNSPVHTEPVDMVSSLIAQLIGHDEMTDEEYTQMLRILRTKCKDLVVFHQSRDNERTFSKLCAIFLEILQSVTSCRRVQIVLDAMDECSSPERIVEFIRLIDKAFCQCKELRRDASSSVECTGLHVQLILTGRPAVDRFFSVLPSVSAIRMDAGNDIDAYVSSRIDRNASLRDHKDKIIRTISTNSDGMFRYAVLVLDELESILHVSISIDKRLSTIPKDIFGMYELILSRLSSEGECIRKRVFLWLINPSTVSQATTVSVLQHVCVAPPGDPSFDIRTVIVPTKEQILSCCDSFIELYDSSGGEIGEGGDPFCRASELGGLVRFTHRTVREFLLQKPEALSITVGTVQRPYYSIHHITEREGYAFKFLFLITQMLTVPSYADMFQGVDLRSLHAHALGQWERYAKGEIEDEQPAKPSFSEAFLDLLTRLAVLKIHSLRMINAQKEMISNLTIEMLP